MEKNGVTAQVFGQLGTGLEQVQDAVAKLIPQTSPKPVEGQDSAQTDIPHLTTEGEKATQTRQAQDERLCLNGVNGVEELKALARLAWQILQDKDQAVDGEDFGSAARLRDAIAALRMVAAEAMDKWPGVPGKGDTNAT